MKSLLASKPRKGVSAVNGGGGSRPPVSVTSLVSYAKLMSDLLLYKGTGSPTFTCTSPRYIPDDAGVIQTIPAGTAAFVGSKYQSEPASTNKCTCYSVPRADNTSAQLLTTAQQQCDSGWTAAGEATANTGTMRMLSTGALSTLIPTTGVTIVTGQQYKMIYTVSGTPSGAMKGNDGIGSIPSTAGTHTVYFTGVVGNAWLFARVAACDITIDDVSLWSVTDSVGISSNALSGAFRQNIPNMTLSGSTSAVLSIVDETASIAAAGLSGIVNGGKVYDILGFSDGSSNVIISGITTAVTNSMSVYMRVLAGTGILRDSASLNSVSSTSSAWTRLKSENLSAAIRAIQITAGVSAHLQFIIPQLEEQAVATSIILTSGASATRAAVALSYPTSGNLPASGTRHIALNWEPDNVAVGLQQMIWATRVDASNYTAIWANGVIVAIEKRVAGVSEYVTFDLTPVIGTTYLIEGYIYADNTMGLKVNGVAQSGTLGAELLLDTGFDDTSKWLKSAGSITVTGGKGVFTGTTANLSLYQAVITPYKFYQHMYDLDSISGGLRPQLGGVQGTQRTTAPLTQAQTKEILLSGSTVNGGLATTATTTAQVDNLSIKQLLNNSTTLAPQIGSTMHVGGLSDGASSATLVAHAGFDNLKIYSA